MTAVECDILQADTPSTTTLHHVSWRSDPRGRGIYRGDLDAACKQESYIYTGILMRLAPWQARQPATARLDQYTVPACSLHRVQSADRL